MSRPLKFSIIISFIWIFMSSLVIFNLVYVEYPDLNGDFWLVLVRTIAVITALPLILAWGTWWFIKK